MSDNHFEFDSDTEEGSQPYELLKKGKYEAQAIDASVGFTKNGLGTFLKLTLEIQGGEYAGRQLFPMLLLDHESEKAKKFGRQKIKDLCVACGLTGMVTDIEAFKFKPMIIQVGVEKSKDDQYDDKNVVKRFLPMPAIGFHDDPVEDVYKKAS
jgi:hypothetical protein